MTIVLRNVGSMLQRTEMTCCCTGVTSAWYSMASMQVDRVFVWWTCRTGEGAREGSREGGCER